MIFALSSVFGVIFSENGNIFLFDAFLHGVNNFKIPL